MYAYPLETFIYIARYQTRISGMESRYTKHESNYTDQFVNGVIFLISLLTW
jgi:hypothetical protein